MMIRGFFTTFLMKQRLGIFGFGKASLGLGLLLISINSDLSVCKGTTIFEMSGAIFLKKQKKSLSPSRADDRKRLQMQ
jgi:hypothetical protein